MVGFVASFDESRRVKVFLVADFGENVIVPVKTLDECFSHKNCLIRMCFQIIILIRHYRDLKQQLTKV